MVAGGTKGANYVATQLQSNQEVVKCLAQGRTGLEKKIHRQQTADFKYCRLFYELTLYIIQIILYFSVRCVLRLLTSPLSRLMMPVPDKRASKSC